MDDAEEKPLKDVISAIWREGNMPKRIPTYRPPIPHCSYSRPSAAKRGYDHHWRKIRLEKLRMNPLCEYCLAKTEPMNTLAVDVDHVDGNTRNTDWTNLKSTCRKCHAAKTMGGGV